VADHAVIGYVTGGWDRHEFTASLLGLCLEGKTPVDTVLALEWGPNISTGRNRLCADFLARPGTPQWLFMCDTDMVLPADTIDRLIAAADPAEVPVVGGLCWSLEAGRKVPTMYELVQKAPGELAFTRHVRWPDDAVVRVSATGAACLLIHRSALERVREHAADPAAPWFRETALKNAPLSLMGEDMTFCLRCAAAGIPVHVHTGVKAGHMKTTMLI
jgi:GT2 family glycosyltransferase